ncbi:unnamed protein product [Cuscuta epithymum]|uniref:Uncharacterized protein n=1 Tax=Cuscuta epithymum TaxID=186058 RepID=A0AAV0E1H1_9ASTE|nr:unnamed protein product [Cuscuta epithymum]
MVWSRWEACLLSFENTFPELRISINGGNQGAHSRPIPQAALVESWRLELRLARWRDDQQFTGGEGGGVATQAMAGGANGGP